MRATSYVLLWLSLAALGVFADNAIIIPAFGEDRIMASVPGSPASEDPGKALSEFNHHVAGWALVGVGFLVLASFLSPDLRALRYLWPALFVFAGLFLALWSDAEIWPRGNLSWAWLLHHDQEAGQHKIYALFLISMGVVEYLCDRIVVLYLGKVMEVAPARELYQAPKHPYTEALLEASPRPDPDARRDRRLLEGDIPSPVDPPSGCVFRTRCPYALDACAADVPALREVAPGRFKACIRDDIL